MVACAAVSQSQVLLAVPMTTCTLSIEHLKEKLLSAVENGQSTDVQEVLVELEKAPITKDILEATRIGASVNDVRRKIAEKWPDISKRCRNLIKSWQKMVEVRPPSTASSANGTPNLVSPGIARLARKVTPGTPVNRRVTSTGLTNGRGLTVSPANGSYAPKDHVSPNGSLPIHKSQSVGTELLAKGEENRNGKRKSEENAATSTLKRTKTVVGLASANAPGVVHSVSAARMAVQSTSELVAQLSQNLPDHMNIDSSLRQHEEKVKREQQDEELAISLHGTLATTQPERKKRKYERKIKPEPDAARESPPNDERRGGLILRLPRIHKEESIKEEERPSTPVETSHQSTSQPASRPESRPESRIETKPARKKVNWLDMLPPMSELQKKIDERNAKPLQALEDPKKIYLIPAGEEEIVALPYLEDPSIPDFITYKYPDAAQFYAEESNRNV